MKNETRELLKQIKAYRNDMVARNYPFQQISDIITRWETKDVKTISEQSQDELEPIRDFLDQAEKEKKELEESYKESVRQAKKRKNYDEHDRDTSKDPFKGTSIEGKD
jgi:t-SNARE complex subunit (syntaxin)